MSLWRLERLRLLRTGRLWVVVGVFGLFGVLGPVGARYLPQIIERFGGGVEVVVPEPTALDGMAQFLSNAGQLGLLAVLAVTASAMSFDARAEWSAFLRTRVGSVGELVVPRLVWSTAAAVAGLVVGSVVAAVLTGVLIDAVPVGDLWLGTAFAAVYLAFTVAVVAVAASFAGQTMASVLLSVGVLLVLPILQAVPALSDWVPSRLLGATTSLMAGTPASELARSLVVTLALIPSLVAIAVGRLAYREG